MCHADDYRLLNKMSNQAGPSNIPQASLLELKALTAQHTDRFVREGKASVRAQARGKAVDKVMDIRRPSSVIRSLLQLRDPFSRPSPGLVKRLATEARNDVKHRVFQDDSGPSDEQRHSNMIAKARKYDRMRRGDLSGLSEKELSESVLDVTKPHQMHADAALTRSSSDSGKMVGPTTLRILTSLLLHFGARTAL